MPPSPTPPSRPFFDDSEPFCWPPAAPPAGPARLDDLLVLPGEWHLDVARLTRPDRLDLVLLGVAVSALTVAVLALVLVLGVLGGRP